MKPDTRPATAVLAACALALALGACNREPERQQTAAGEILPGSASDAMIPLDTVRSEPPLAPRATASGRPGKDEATAAATEGPAPADEGAAPPAAEGAAPTPNEG